MWDGPQHTLARPGVCRGQLHRPPRCTHTSLHTHTHTHTCPDRATRAPVTCGGREGGGVCTDANRSVQHVVPPRLRPTGRRLAVGSPQSKGGDRSFAPRRTRRAVAGAWGTGGPAAPPVGGGARRQGGGGPGGGTAEGLDSGAGACSSTRIRMVWKAHGACYITAQLDGDIPHSPDAPQSYGPSCSIICSKLTACDLCPIV